MPLQDKRVLAVMTDLFFSAKINDTAKKFGMSVKFIREKDVLDEELKTAPTLVIFDLNYQAIDPIALIREMKTSPETRRIGTIGFISHTETELKMKALESGCDMVVARSVFAQNLPTIFKRYATIQTASRS